MPGASKRARTHSVTGYSFFRSSLLYVRIICHPNERVEHCLELRRYPSRTEPPRDIVSLQFLRTGFHPRTSGEADRLRTDLEVLRDGRRKTFQRSGSINELRLLTRRTDVSEV